MLTYRVGDPDRPRGHALVFFRDTDNPDEVWGTYLVVVPIQMDLGKYIPAAFAPQLAGQLSSVQPAAYPLPPVPEKVEGGVEWLERVASLRGDDLIDGGVLRVSDPLQALHPVAEIGAQYAERCASYHASAEAEPSPAAREPAGAAVDVDDLLLQVMPDREKIGRLARLTGTLRYAVEGGDRRLADETVSEMQRIGRHLGDKYRAADLIQAAQSSEAQAGQLAQLYLERCYKLADEDYSAIAELERKIKELQAPG